MEVIKIEILKKLYSQYVVWISEVKLKKRFFIDHKIRIYELYNNKEYKYEAIFNIGYTDDKKNRIIFKSYGNTEEEVMEELEKKLLEKKDEFLIHEAEELFY